MTHEQHEQQRDLRLHRDGCYEIDVVWKDGSTSRYLAGSLPPQELAESLERVVADIRAHDRVPNQSDR